ncbi:EamA family transporter [Acinetobacter sp. MD2]|uniref:EamA family transporter n=1 Tax=Acinetobacter sp. MD2 TaxID=2600066 RepID=UPI002D1F69C1|nr:EamA family transporter [Acinetobacter sp. MD2]MEB3766225.1 EamA family transporter [Acinetobacter sp. MD2]
MQSNHEIKYLFLTLIAPILWGTTYFTTTEFLPADRPFLAAIIRVLPAGLLLTLLKRKLPHGQQWWQILVLSFLNIACFQSLLFFAAYHLEGGIAAAIGAVQPLIIFFLAIVVDKKSTDMKSFMAILLMIFGMWVLLVLGKDQQHSFDVLGCAAAFMGAVSMALGTYLSKKWKPNVDNLTFTGWQLLFGGIILMPLFFVFETLPSTLSLANILGYSYLAIFGSLIAYSLWFLGVSKLSPVAVSILGVFSPMTALFIGWIFLGQRLSLLQMIGFGIVLGCVIFVQMQSWGQGKKQRLSQV